MERIRGVSANLLTEQYLAEGKGVVLQLWDWEGTKIPLYLCERPVCHEIVTRGLKKRSFHTKKILKTHL
jgi:hypothetical protein